VVETFDIAHRTSATLANRGETLFSNCHSTKEVDNKRFH
jgi:hypothetical protein